MSQVTQAMLLAAGLATRLRPLTDHVPKPLLPFWDRTLLDFTFDYLAHFGISDVSVNVHHGKEPFLKALEARQNLMRTTAFTENPIFGTGGGIKNMKPFVTSDTFVVVNCDFLTDIDLKAAAAFHERSRALATMVLIPTSSVKKYGEIGVSDKGRVVTFPYGKPPGGAVASGMFSGVHILSREIFTKMPESQVFDIVRDVYAPLIEKGAPVFGWVTPARWYDVGEIPLYIDTQVELLQRPLGWMKPPLAQSPTAKVASDATVVGPALISDRVVIESGCQIGPGVILGPGCKIGKNTQMDRTVVYPGVVVGENQKYTGKVLT